MCSKPSVCVTVSCKTVAVVNPFQIGSGTRTMHRLGRKGSHTCSVQNINFSCGRSEDIHIKEFAIFPSPSFSGVFISYRLKSPKFTFTDEEIDDLQLKGHVFIT